jgi:hypothetical protein
MSNFYSRILVLVILSLFTLPAQAAIIPCVYDANAEWPLVPDMVCQSDEPTPGGLVADDDSGAGTVHPTCVSASLDPDGDGWGWENRRSCRVVAANTTSPVCQRDSDTNGDGWGWEGGRSCRVVPAPAAKQLVCLSRLSDPDGDGWGFENGKSCRVVGAVVHPVCSANAIDPDSDGWGWENDRSCKVIPRTEQEVAAEQAPLTEQEQEQVQEKVTSGVVYEQNFDNSSVGSYTPQQLNNDWGIPEWHLGFVQGRASIVSERGRGNVMTVMYPANTYGAAGATAFLSDLEFGVDLPASYEELYLSYDIRFAEGFEFVKGGKLPGLCGYNKSNTAVTGCNTGGGYPSGFDGWSARGMWRVDGLMENYVYHAAQENYYGDDLYWSVKAVPGKWHRVQHRVLLNTPGIANGVLEAWIDGKKVLGNTKMLYRNTGDIGINLFYFSTFFGGNDPSWAPAEDQFISFDNFRISTQPDAQPGPLNDERLSAAPKESIDRAQEEVSEIRSNNGGGGSMTLLQLVWLLCSCFFVGIKRTMLPGGSPTRC